MPKVSGWIKPKNSILSPEFPLRLRRFRGRWALLMRLKCTRNVLIYKNIARCFRKEVVKFVLRRLVMPPLQRGCFWSVLMQRVYCKFRLYSQSGMMGLEFRCRLSFRPRSHRYRRLWRGINERIRRKD